jgi:PAS domain S-box-containing protein
MQFASFLPKQSINSQLIVDFPWETTSLGPIATWHPGMKTTLGNMLRSPMPIVTLWGEDGYMIYNDAYSVFAGQRHPTLLGSKVREGWPEVADFNDHVMRVVMQGGTLTYADQELTLVRAGVPELLYANLDYFPATYDDGQIGGVIALVVETTAKVTAERALRHSEAKFRTFAQATLHHMWTASPDGALDWFNDRVYEYAGVAPGSLDGEGWGRIIDPADAAAATARWADAVRTGTPYEMEFRIRRHDGASRWHLARAVPIRGAEGELARWIGSSTDIDDQKTSAQALAVMNATLEQQVAARTEERDRMWRLSKDVLLVADFEAQLVSVSPAFTAILGWKSADVIGTSFMELVHPDDRADTLGKVAALSSGAHVFRFENRYRCKDGSYRSLSWTASPDASFIHAIGRDITADLQQAEAMRRTEVALQQAQKMETIGKLTGGVAHDFNNLLQVISGNLQLIAPLVHDRPDVQRRLDNALAGVDRGARLASYLLAFARRQPLAPKVVKVSRLLNGMEDMLRRTLGAEVEIETVMSGGLWSTAIDVAQVENAILNLAINARDAMDGAGKLTIEVNNTLLDSAYCESHLDVTPGQYVMIAVSDTGSGMTAAVLAQAFEPFFSTKPEGKGTGLGLSMVYGLVKQSGGHIKIYSEVGEGTTVKLYLPRSREAEDLYTVLETQPAVGGNETILVAEDDDDVRATVVDMLTELGYRVLKASDAAAALTVIDSGMPIDLLFTDVVMPGTLRSPELARKARERLPEIAVLFTSGYTENAIVHGGRLDAGVELIGKPYTKESLARKIRHVLGNQKQGAVKAAPAAPVAQAADSPAKTLNILLVEDEAEIRESTRDMIRLIGHEVRAVATAEEALAALGPQFDVLITDHQLPGMQGDVLIEMARQRVPHLQVAMASGYADAAGGAGAKKLVKPYSMQQLRQLLESLASRDGDREVVR